MLINQFLIANKQTVAQNVKNWITNLYDVSDENIEQLLSYVDMKMGHLELFSENELININQFSTITITHLPNLIIEFKKALTIKNANDIGNHTVSDNQLSYKPINAEMYGDAPYSGSITKIDANSLSENLRRYGWGLATIGINDYIDDLMTLIKYMYYPVESDV